MEHLTYTVTITGANSLLEHRGLVFYVILH
jgi:hypothetical protein